jgi:hypothetical protein
MFIDYTRLVRYWVYVFVLCAVLLLDNSSAFPVAPDPQSIVDRFYPQSLIDAATTSGRENQFHRNSCFAVYDSFPDLSAKTIIAGYTNDVSAAIEVMQAAPNHAFSVVFIPSGLLLTGVECSVQLVDVDGDRVNEVQVSFTSLRGNTMDWIFRWSGSQLVNIGPVSEERQSRLVTSVMNGEFIDLYHDGTMQLLSTGEYPPPLDGSPVTSPDLVYKLGGGVFVLDKPVIVAFDFLRRATKAPQTLDLPFSKVAGASGPYTLTIVNGDKDGNNRLSSATLSLNGKTIISPNEFNQRVEFLSVSVELESQNLLRVELASAPGAKLLITIQEP